MSYVVEISVIPLDCNDPRVQALMPNSKIPTSPIFQCEDGQIYFRKHSTLVKVMIKHQSTTERIYDAFFPSCMLKLSDISVCIYIISLSISMPVLWKCAPSFWKNVCTFVFGTSGDKLQREAAADTLHWLQFPPKILYHWCLNTNPTPNCETFHKKRHLVYSYFQVLWGAYLFVHTAIEVKKYFSYKLHYTQLQKHL